MRQKSSSNGLSSAKMGGFLQLLCKKITLLAKQSVRPAKTSLLTLPAAQKYLQRPSENGSLTEPNRPLRVAFVEFHQPGKRK